MIEIVVEGPETILVEKMKRARRKEEKIVKVVEEIKKAGVRALRCDKWKIEGDLVLKESKVYISKKIELVIRNYWWPEVTKNVGKYIEGCDSCQRMKNKTEALVGKLMANEVLEKL